MAGDDKKEDDRKANEGFLIGAEALLPETLNRTGAFIFFIASASAVLLLVFSGVAGLLDDKVPNVDLLEPLFGRYEAFRIIDLLLKVAAVGIVVVILAGQRNGLVTAISVLVIGLLIIPTKDMVRVWLLASDSDRTLDHFYGTDGTSPELRGRDTQLAANIVDILHLSGIAEDIEDRGTAIELIENEIENERATTLLERARSRGALEVLARIQIGASERTTYRYGADERHLEVLRFLRNSGLITYVYDDYETIEMTELGTQVLWLSLDDNFGPSGRDELRNSMMLDCMPLGSRVTEMTMPPYGDTTLGTVYMRRVLLTRNGAYVLLQVPSEASEGVNSSDTRNLTLRVEEISSLSHDVDYDPADEEAAGTLDPVLTVLQINESTLGIECPVIAVLDDASTFLEGKDAAPDMHLSLAPGRYVVRISETNGSPGFASLAASWGHQSLDSTFAWVSTRGLADRFARFHFDLTQLQDSAVEISDVPTSIEVQATNPPRYYIFTAAVAGTYVVEHQSEDYDTTLGIARIVDDALIPDSTNDDGGVGFNSYLTIELGVTDEIAIFVGSFSLSETGNGHLSIELDED